MPPRTPVAFHKIPGPVWRHGHADKFQLSACISVANTDDEAIEKPPLEVLKLSLTFQKVCIDAVLTTHIFSPYNFIL